MTNQSKYNYVNLSLPKGKLLPPTSSLLNEIGLNFDNYTKDSRIYRLETQKYKNIKAKIFHEKDIPVQISIGNYDLGICGLDWIEELLAKYPSSQIVKIADLEYDKGTIFLATSKYGNIHEIDQLYDKNRNWRVVTEYPNLAEYMLLNLRIPRFKVFPVWGAAEAYVPENADILVIRAKSEAELAKISLIPIKQFLASSAYLIANKHSWQKKNLSNIISLFSRGIEMKTKPWLQIKIESDKYHNGSNLISTADKVWLAIPDGHQQKPALEFLNKTGLKLKGYSGDEQNRRPSSNIDWLSIKTIRPQDMPMQVANDNFDLAITGIDWFSDHIARFPSSPITRVLDLGFGEVKIVAVVNENMPVDTIDDLKKLLTSGKIDSLRVASEYINIADTYLHSKHISRYKVIPTWGATEALLPEDADILIENTQTGKTLTTNKLKIIDTLFKSTGCIIGNKNSLNSPAKKDKIKQLITMFKQAL